MKKIICSLFFVISSLACATTVPVQESAQKIVEEPKSWASCDYKKDINQGVCVFDLEKDGDEVGLAEAAQILMNTFCDNKYGYTDIFPLPYKDKIFFIYFKCGHVGQPNQEDPSVQEEGRSL